ncbi:MAG: hypothetical protein IJP68_12675 [Selenomonadaceae bacterium]|nr:hypothetical protein [Selenomonadaceae bacterium]
MAEKITVKIELDADLKAEAEKLYGKIDLTLEEAIPILIKYNVEQQDGEIPNRKDESEHTELFGALSKYANPALIPFEDGAWERAMVRKYAQNLG